MNSFKIILAYLCFFAVLALVCLAALIRSLSLGEEITGDQERLAGDITRHLEEHAEDNEKQCALSIHRVNEESPCDSDFRSHPDNTTCYPALAKAVSGPLVFISHPISYKIYVSSYTDLSELFEEKISFNNVKGKFQGFSQTYCENNNIFLGIYSFNGKAWPW